MKKILFCLVLVFISNSLFAQKVEEVTLVTTGSAATEEEAILVALRGAIEQTFGTFVSANTTLLNDDLVKDEIVSVSKGNIKKYEKIATTVLSNGQMMVTVKSEISISNLITYAQNKGSKAEFAGATFGQNLKLMRLKSDNTRKAYENLCAQIMVLLDDAFDYNIELQEPKAVKLYYIISDPGDYSYTTKDGSYLSDGYKLDAIVTVMANEVNGEIYRLVNGTLKAISLTETEFHEFEKLGLDCCSYRNRGCLQLDNQLFRVYLPISYEDIEKIERPVVEKITKGFINYVILDSANSQEYIWRARQRTDKVLGYKVLDGSGSRITTDINRIDNGLGLFNSKDVAYNGYGLGRGDYGNLIGTERTNLGIDRLCYGYGSSKESNTWENWESLSLINLNTNHLGRYRDVILREIRERRASIYREAKLSEEQIISRIYGKKDNALVLPEEIEYVLNNEFSESSRMEIAKMVIPNKELKEYSKKKQAIDGQLITSYFPVEKSSNKALLSYKLSFFFTEEEISQFTGLEIVPQK